VDELRARVDLLIALTHIGLSNDKKLAEACPEIDLILGGHSHTVLDAPLMIGKTAICQTGSHGRFFGRYVWSEGALVEAELIPFTIH
jgi:2',3'-cyclic-nucleotide 2'-phosphodiesterase (5'-nucleotidase family)